MHIPASHVQKGNAGRVKTAMLSLPSTCNTQQHVLTPKLTSQLRRSTEHQVGQAVKRLQAEGGGQGSTCLGIDLEGVEVAISQSTQQVGHPLKLSKQ